MLAETWKKPRFPVITAEGCNVGGAEPGRVSFPRRSWSSSSLLVSPLLRRHAGPTAGAALGCGDPACPARLAPPNRCTVVADTGRAVRLESLKMSKEKWFAESVLRAGVCSSAGQGETTRSRELSTLRLLRPLPPGTQPRWARNQSGQPRWDRRLGHTSQSPALAAWLPGCVEEGRGSEHGQPTEVGTYLRLKAAGGAAMGHPFRSNEA